jgi:hypothetical protein
MKLAPRARRPTGAAERQALDLGPGLSRAERSTARAVASED